MTIQELTPAVFLCKSPCLRKFKSAAALAQHKTSSPKHVQAEFLCEPPCLSKFKSAAALAQHKTSSPKHVQAEFLCEPPCSCKFKSAAALAQHKIDSPKHVQRGTLSNGVLASTHAKFVCGPPCSREFKTAAALAQHKNGAQIHAQRGTPPNGVQTLKQTEFLCEPSCSGKFKSAAALAQHKANSPKHNQRGTLPNSVTKAKPVNGAAVGLSDDVSSVDRISNDGTASELQGAQGALVAAVISNVFSVHDAGQGTDQAAAGAKGGDGESEKATCILCNKSFLTAGALANHIRDSPKHVARAANGDLEQEKQQQQQPQPQPQPQQQQTQQQPEENRTITKVQRIATPLDMFFALYPEFPYDFSLQPATSFRKLRHFYGWRKRSDEDVEAWEDYQHALMDEVRLWFGTTENLSSWHQLCRAVGIQDPPETKTQCKKVLQATHVNIVDLVQWGRNGQPEDDPVKVYKTVRELKKYTLKTGKIFRKVWMQNEKGETNIVLRHLLRRLLR